MIRSDSPPRAVRSGEAVYDTLLCRDGRMHPAWPLHMGRLLDDARRVGLPMPDVDALLAEITARVGGSVGFMRVRVDVFAVGPDRLDHPPMDVAYAVEARPGIDRVRPPARVILGPRLRNAENPLSGVKVAATPSERALRRAAAAQGADEVIVCDIVGHLSEATTSALLMGFDDTTIVTPHATSAPLRSTTVALLSAYAAALQRRPGSSRFDGLAVVERAVDAAELIDAPATQPAWCALANAVAGARTVERFDGVALAAPPQRWTTLMRALVDGEDAATVAAGALAGGIGPAWAVCAFAHGLAHCRVAALGPVWSR